MQTFIPSETNPHGPDCLAEFQTIGWTDEEFSRVRNLTKGIGASEAAAVCGLSSYESPMSIYLRKTGEIGPVVPNPRMKSGKRLEQLISEEAAETLNLALIPADVILRSVKTPFMFASPDRFVMDERGEIGLLEAKAIGYWEYQKSWVDGEPSTSALLQVLHQMHVTGHTWGYLAPWCDLEPLPPIRIDRFKYRDDIQNLVELERRFWFNHVVAGVEPPVDGHRATTDALLERWNQPDENTVELSSVTKLGKAFTQWCADDNRLKKLAKEATTNREEPRNLVRNTLGNSTVCLVDGVKRATWKPRKDGVRVLEIPDLEETDEPF